MRFECHSAFSSKTSSAFFIERSKRSYSGIFRVFMPIALQRSGLGRDIFFAARKAACSVDTSRKAFLNLSIDRFLSKLPSFMAWPFLRCVSIHHCPGRSPGHRIFRTGIGNRPDARRVRRSRTRDRRPTLLLPDHLCIRFGLVPSVLILGFRLPCSRTEY